MSVTTHFTKLTSLAKVVYIATVIATLGGGFAAIVQVSAYASDKFEDKVVDIIYDHAYDAVNLQIAGELKDMRISAEQSSISQQISMGRMEIRFIQSEIMDITRNAPDTGLSIGDQNTIIQLNDDRNSIKAEIKQLEKELHLLNYGD